MSKKTALETQKTRHSVSTRLNYWTLNSGWNENKMNLFLETFVWAMPTPSRRNLKTEVSLWKRIHQLFSIRTTPEEFENSAITGHFGKLDQQNHMHDYGDGIAFETERFQNVLRPH